MRPKRSLKLVALKITDQKEAVPRSSSSRT